MKSINIVVPCYNEENSLLELYKRLKEVTSTIENYQFNFVFVNDGSKDKTLDVIRKLCDENSDCGYISFSRNFGKEAAMHAGLVRSKDKDALIFIDADLQHNPKHIKDFITYYEEGYKIVYTRKKKRNESALKKFLTKMFYIIFFKLTKLKLESGLNDYQLLDQRAIQAYLSVNDKDRFLKGIFSYVGFNKKCIDIDIDPRFAGKTSFNFRKLFKYAFVGINQFSDFLLLVPKWSAIITVLLSVYNIIQYFFLESYFQTKGQLFYALQNNILFFLLFVSIYFMMYLLYSTRKDLKDRPIFIVEEEKIND